MINSFITLGYLSIIYQTLQNSIWILPVYIRLFDHQPHETVGDFGSSPASPAPAEREGEAWLADSKE